MKKISVAVVAFFAVLALLALVQTVRSAAFAFHPQARENSFQPWDDFLVHHNCFSAYHEAARLAHDLPNVYDPAQLQMRPPGDASPRPSWQEADSPRRTLGGLFFVDAYEYPPPFLLLPRAIIAAGADFLAARAVWFVLQVSLLVGALALVAWHLGGAVGRRFALVAPVVYLAIGTQNALQLGNFQGSAIALTMIAMVAFARRRDGIGGALFSFVILTKLFPGILVITLAAQRRWRAILATIVGAVVWCAAALAVFGVAPFKAFVTYQLPAIASGEAFGMLRIPFVAALNESVYGVPIKLGGSFHAGSIAAWIYTAFLVVAAWLLGRRLLRAPVDRAAEAAVYMLVLVLATFRAPFLPQEYAAIGPMWLIALLAARHGAVAARAALLVGLAIVVQVHAPWALLEEHPTAAALVVLVAQIGVVALCVTAAVWSRQLPARADM